MHRLIGSFIVKEGFVQYSILWQIIVYSFKKLDFKPVIINQQINFAESRFQANNHLENQKSSPCQAKKIQIDIVR